MEAVEKPGESRPGGRGGGGAQPCSLPIRTAIDDVLVFAGCGTIDGVGGTLALSNHSAAINTVADPTLREQLA